MFYYCFIVLYLEFYYTYNISLKMSSLFKGAAAVMSPLFKRSTTPISNFPATPPPLPPPPLPPPLPPSPPVAPPSSRQLPPSFKSKSKKSPAPAPAPAASTAAPAAASTILKTSATSKKELLKQQQEEKFKKPNTADSIKNFTDIPKPVKPDNKSEDGKEVKNLKKNFLDDQQGEAEEKQNLIQQQTEIEQQQLQQQINEEAEKERIRSMSQDIEKIKEQKRNENLQKLLSIIREKKKTL
jgi:hypothetical protein